MGLPGDEKSLIVSLVVSIQYTNVTDGRTDGRTDRHRSTAKTSLCIASRGKNCFIYQIWTRRFRFHILLDFIALSLRQLNSSSFRWHYIFASQNTYVAYHVFNVFYVFNALMFLKEYTSNWQFSIIHFSRAIWNSHTCNTARTIAYQLFH